LMIRSMRMRAHSQATTYPQQRLISVINMPLAWRSGGIVSCWNEVGSNFSVRCVCPNGT
jgi:hypothetical protein